MRPTADMGPASFLSEEDAEHWAERNGIVDEDEAALFRGELMTLLPPLGRLCWTCGADGSDGRACTDCMGETTREDER